MDFTREPLVESVITPREGCKLVVRSSKGIGQEEFFVDALEMVSFGGCFFFRSLERPKAFLVPVTDYEVLEVRETRVVLKHNAGEKGSIKIAAPQKGRDRGDRSERSERPERSERADRPERSERPERTERPDREREKEVVGESDDKSEDGKEGGGRTDRKRRRQSRRRRRSEEGASTTESGEIIEQTDDILEGDEGAQEPAERSERPERAERSERQPRPERSERGERTERPDRSERSEPKGPKVVPTVTKLLPPPGVLISETIARYKENESFKGAFFDPNEQREQEEGTPEEQRASTHQAKEEVEQSLPFGGGDGWENSGKAIAESEEIQPESNPWFIPEPSTSHTEKTENSRGSSPESST